MSFWDGLPETNSSMDDLIVDGGYIPLYALNLMTNTETNPGASMTSQDRANERAYSDGTRCAHKGLGITKAGSYDYATWDRLFERGYRAFCRGLDKEEARNEWRDGYQEELGRLEALRGGTFLCGRPL